MRAIFALALVLALPLARPVSAQPAQAAALSDRMAPLAVLVGEWRGSGWMLMPDGARAEFISSETVTSRLSGAALLVEGRHVDPVDGSVVHDAMAMLTWDPRANTYRFRAALANGHGGDFPLTAEPGRFAWTTDTPNGRLDYVADFDATTWRETGTITSADGDTRQIFEMTLTRQ